MVKTQQSKYEILFINYVILYIICNVMHQNMPSGHSRFVLIKKTQHRMRSNSEREMQKNDKTMNVVNVPKGRTSLAAYFNLNNNPSQPFPFHTVI